MNAQLDIFEEVNLSVLKDELKKVNLRRGKKKKIVQDKQKELQEIQRRRCY